LTHIFEKRSTERAQRCGYAGGLTVSKMRAIVVRFDETLRIVGVNVEGIQMGTYLLDRCKVLPLRDQPTRLSYGERLDGDLYHASACFQQPTLRGNRTTRSLSFIGTHAGLLAKVVGWSDEDKVVLATLRSCGSCLGGAMQITYMVNDVGGVGLNSNTALGISPRLSHAVAHIESEVKREQAPFVGLSLMTAMNAGLPVWHWWLMP